VASWLVRLLQDQEVRIGALAGDIVLCSWEDTLLSQCLSPPHPEGSRNTPSRFMLLKPG